jgi:hypothetical protein
MMLFDLVKELTEVGKELEKLGYRTDKARSIPIMQESIDKKIYPLEFKNIHLHTINGELVAVIKNKEL